MRRIIAACIFSIADLICVPAISQHIGEIVVVEKHGAHACRTSRAAQLQGVDLAGALTNGTCVRVPLGQSMRIVHDPNPPESVKGGFLADLLAPRRIEIVGHAAGGNWYIASDAIGVGRRMEEKLDQLEREIRAGKAAPSPPASVFVSRSQLIPIAQKYLASAGIADYKFLPATSKDELAWEYTDGSRGTISMTRPEAKASLTSILGQIIERDTAYCKGQYTSGYMPARYHLGSEIRKAYTACSDGPRSFAFYYSVAALPSGAIMRLGAGASQPSMNNEAVPRAERLEDAALKSTNVR